MKVDAAAYLGAWPFRNIDGTVRGLLAMMRELALDQALVSPLPAFFHTDPAAANDHLLRRLRGRTGLWAAPIINPRMADAGSGIERLARRPQVRAIRLTPGFHGYSAAEAREVVQGAAAYGLAVVIQLRMQDERSHPPTSRVPPAPLEEVIALAAGSPGTRLIAAAARLDEVTRHAESIRALPNLWLDISHLDGLECLKRASEVVGAGKLLFATCWPFFYARSASLKMQEADLPRREAEMVAGLNAADVFGLATQPSPAPSA
jgi:hypothetical protein